MKRHLKLLAAIFLLMELAVLSAFGQSARDSSLARYGDPLFPPTGQWMISIATGEPFIGIGEATYGIGDHTAIGGLGGAIPRVVGISRSLSNGTLPAYGIRVRQEFLENDNFRLYGRMPIIFYPKSSRSDRQAWFLLWPAAVAEWNANWIRYWAVAGIAGKVCAHSLTGLEQFEEMPGGYTETIGGGASVALAPRFTLSAEASVVTQGFNILDGDKLQGPPVILIVQTSYVIGW